MNLRYTDKSKDDVELAFEWNEKCPPGLKDLAKYIKSVRKALRASVTL